MRSNWKQKYSNFQIHRTEKDEEFKGRRGSSQSGNSLATSSGASSSGTFSKASEKFRKKLAELEAQLVLASPSLLFQVGTNFYLSENLTIQIILIRTKIWAMDLIKSIFRNAKTDHRHIKRSSTL